MHFAEVDSLHDLDELHEKCGIFGIFHPKDLVQIIQIFKTLQHRGKDGAGVSVSVRAADGSIFELLKSQVYTRKNPHTNEIIESGAIANLEKDLQTIENFAKSPHAAIGQNRYATTGELNKFNIQPINLFIEVEIAGVTQRFSISLAHNGNVFNAPELEGGATYEGQGGTSDSWWMSQRLIASRPLYRSWHETFIHVFPEFDGAYSLLMLTEDGDMHAARDPWGLRPLCFGQTPDGRWIVASESVALEAAGAEYMRDLLPGELITFHKDGGYTSTIFGYHKNGEQKCTVESHYFEKAASFSNGKTNVERRRELGIELSKRIRERGVNPEICVPVMNSGEQVAKGVAEGLGQDLTYAITVDPEVGRTFIEATERARALAAYNKLIINMELMLGKRVLIIDDSLVRGNTLKILFYKIYEKMVELLMVDVKARNLDAQAVEVFRQQTLVRFWNQVFEEDQGKKKKRQKPENPLENFMPKFQELVKKIGAKGVYGPTEINVAAGAPPIIGDCNLGVAIKKDQLLVGEWSNGLSHRQIEDTVAEEIGVDSFTFSTTEMVEKAWKTDGCTHCFGGKHPVKDSEKPLYLAEMEKNEDRTWVVVPEYKDEKAATPQMALDTIPQHNTVVKKLFSPEFYFPEQDFMKILEGGEIPDVIVLAGWRNFISKNMIKKADELGIDLIFLDYSLHDAKPGKTMQTTRGSFTKVPFASAQKNDQIGLAFQKHNVITGVTAMTWEKKDGAFVPKVLLKQEVHIREDESLSHLENRMDAAAYAMLPVVWQVALFQRKLKQVDGVVV